MFEDIGKTLLSAVYSGNIGQVRQIINSFGLSYSSSWSDGLVLLRMALEQGHMEIARLILEHNPKVNNNTGRPTETLLHLAILKDDTQIAQMLLDKNIEVRSKNKKYRTPLHDALANEMIELAELILDKQPYVNAQDENGVTPLHIACTKNWLTIIKRLINQGANVNCVSKQKPFFEGYTPLHYAIENDNEEVVNFLLMHDVNVNAVANCGTPLIVASRKEHVKVIEDLLNHGADIHSKCPEEWCKGYTSLHFVCDIGNEEAVALLLDKGADVNAKAEDDTTPLHIVVRKQYEEIIELLIQHGANVDAHDKNGKTILYSAVEKENVMFVEDILKYSPDVNNRYNRKCLICAANKDRIIFETLLQYGFTFNPEDRNNPFLLHAIVEKGYFNVAQDLLKHGANINARFNTMKKKGFTLLHTAVKTRQKDMVNLLLNHGANVNDKDKDKKTPIFYAIENNDLEITKLLLTNGVDLGNNPELLNIAVKKKYKEIVEIMLRHGADVNATDENGNTALHLAVLKQGQTIALFNDIMPEVYVTEEIIRLLLSKGANVNAKTYDGMTILHIASENGYTNIVKTLLKYGADINSTAKGNELIMRRLHEGVDVHVEQKYEMTALHLATLRGQEQVVKLLLRHGAKRDCRTTRGVTPVNIAAQCNYPKIVKILLEFGSDFDCRDDYGRTPLHIASLNGCVEVVEILLDYGADINIESKRQFTALDYAEIGTKSLHERYNKFNSRINYDYYSVSACEKIIEIFKLHIIKLKVAHQHLSKKNSKVSEYENSKFKDLLEQCNIEIEIIKNENICDTVFYHDILAENVNQLAMDILNRTLVQALKVTYKSDYKRKFPIYSNIMRNVLKKIQKRKALLELAVDAFLFLFPDFYMLPDYCNKQILNNLPDKDLRMFIVYYNNSILDNFLDTFIVDIWCSTDNV